MKHALDESGSHTQNCPSVVLIHAQLTGQCLWKSLSRLTDFAGARGSGLPHAHVPCEKQHAVAHLEDRGLGFRVFGPAFGPMFHARSSTLSPTWEIGV
jgi:hypothetical protein